MHWYWLCSWLMGYGVGKRGREPEMEICGCPPVSIQPDVPNKLVQMPVRALALHPPWETHQAVDVLYVCSHLKTLLMQLSQHVYFCNIEMSPITCTKEKDNHLSDFKVRFSVQVRCFNVAHTLWFTAGEGEGTEDIIPEPQYETL